ncbi:MAG TPA: hypothetical protein VLG11_00280 [Candidatus Saccharimonadales bacterium]|nr:hypothetical protein [Candidatus Saccharimonadales bacterium]
MTADNPGGRHWAETVGAAPYFTPDLPEEAKPQTKQREPSTISEVFGQELPTLTDAERALLAPPSWREPSEPPVIGAESSPTPPTTRTYFADPADVDRARYYEGFAAVELSDSDPPADAQGPRHAAPNPQQPTTSLPELRERVQSVVNEFGAGLPAGDPARTALELFEAGLRNQMHVSPLPQSAAANTKPTEPELLDEIDFTNVTLPDLPPVELSDGYKAKYRIFQELLEKAREDAAAAAADQHAAAQATRQGGGAHHARSSEVSPLALVYRASGVPEQVADLLRDRIHGQHAALVPYSPDAVQPELQRPREHSALPLPVMRALRALTTATIGGGELVTLAPAQHFLPEPTAEPAPSKNWDWFTPPEALLAAQRTLGVDGVPVFDISTAPANQFAVNAEPAPLQQEPPTVRMELPAAVEAPVWPAVEPEEDGIMVESTVRIEKPAPRSGGQSTLYFPSTGQFGSNKSLN